MSGGDGKLFLIAKKLNVRHSCQISYAEFLLGLTLYQN